MKRHQILAAAAAFISATFLLSSCDVAPIFSAIEEEVELKDPSVRGIVTSMVIVPGDAGGTKYVTNGRVYRKIGVNGSWDEISVPAHRCQQLAYDGTTVYGLMTESDFITPAGIYTLSGKSWTKVAGTNDMALMFSGDGFVYGFTHSVDDDGGSFAMYHVTGAGAGAEISPGTEYALPTSSAVSYDAATDVPAASWFSTTGAVYGSDGVALAGATVTTPPAMVLALTASPPTATNPDGVLYAATSSALWQYAGGDWSSVSHKGTQSNLASIAWLPVGVDSGVVLIAGAATGGYSEVTVTGVATVPALDDSHSPGNGTSSIAGEDQTQYESSLANWTVNSIFVDTEDAGVGSNGYVVYAGVANDKGYDGLWSYYPETRSEWNRE